MAEDPDFTSLSLMDRISDGLSTLLGRDPDAFERTRTGRLIYKFQNGLTVRRRGLTYVLEISYRAGDPVKAAHISGTIAEAYLDDQRAAKGEITARASGWLGDRIGEMRERVRSSEEAVAAYRSANNLVDVTQGNKLINRQVEDLTQQLALARSRTADASARLERVQQATQRNSDPATLSEALQSQVIANLRSQYAETVRTEAEIRRNQRRSASGIDRRPCPAGKSSAANRQRDRTYPGGRPQRLSGCHEPRGGARDRARKAEGAIRHVESSRCQAS